MPISKLETVLVKIDDLVKDPENTRKHDKKNLDAVVGSIKKFGQIEPLIIRKKNNRILGGNCRFDAMKNLGFKEVSVHYVDLDDTTSIALALALNRTGELASWDDEVLSETLKSLQGEFDLSEIGFDKDDLKDFIKELPEFRTGSEDDQGKLDEQKQIECPECGHEFTP